MGVSWGMREGEKKVIWETWQELGCAGCWVPLDVIWTSLCRSYGDIRVWMRDLWIKGLRALVLHFIDYYQKLYACMLCYLHIMTLPLLEWICHENKPLRTHSQCLQQGPAHVKHLLYWTHDPGTIGLEFPLLPQAQITWVPWTKHTPGSQPSSTTGPWIKMVSWQAPSSSPHPSPQTRHTYSSGFLSRQDSPVLVCWSQHPSPDHDSIGSPIRAGDPFLSAPSLSLGLIYCIT